MHMAKGTIVSAVTVLSGACLIRASRQGSNLHSRVEAAGVDLGWVTIHIYIYIYIYVYTYTYTYTDKDIYIYMYIYIYIYTYTYMSIY